MEVSTFTSIDSSTRWPVNGDWMKIVIEQLGRSSAARAGISTVVVVQLGEVLRDLALADGVVAIAGSSSRKG